MILCDQNTDTTLSHMVLLPTKEGDFGGMRDRLNFKVRSMGLRVTSTISFGTSSALTKLHPKLKVPRDHGST